MTNACFFSPSSVTHFHTLCHLVLARLLVSDTPTTASGAVITPYHLPSPNPARNRHTSTSQSRKPSHRRPAIARATWRSLHSVVLLPRTPQPLITHYCGLHNICSELISLITLHYNIWQHNRDDHFVHQLHMRVSIHIYMCYILSIKADNGLCITINSDLTAVSLTVSSLIRRTADIYVASTNTSSLSRMYSSWRIFLKSFFFFPGHHCCLMSLGQGFESLSRLRVWSL